VRRTLLVTGSLLLAVLVATVPTATAAPARQAPARTAVTSGPAGPGLGIRHVFVIVLENEDFAATYETNPNPYLPKTLRQQGTLLTQYYGIGHVSNDNYIAMLSGQAPNPQTQSDCQDYVDFAPSPAVLATDGQAVGTGCVFPPNVPTLADQLERAGKTWHGYMQSMGNDLTREPDRCGEPTASFGTGMRDGTQSAAADDQYAARHNPFVYFHSLIDSGSCERNVVPLPHLADDLAGTSTAPSLSFIVPDLCSDGHDAPCVGKDVAGSSAGGLASVDHFLAYWVPRIQASPAYQEGGLIVVTTDEAANTDATSCCGEKGGPNSPLPGISGLGGGRIGTLVVGRCVRPGATSTTPYNHYSLLRSTEDLLGLSTGGTDGKGHLGFAAAAGLAPFGPDVFAACPASAGQATQPAGTTRLTTAAASHPLPATGGLPLAPLAVGLLAAAGAAGARRTRRPAGADR
jgi:hypothetical protein